MAGVVNIAPPTPTCWSILQGFHRGGDQRIAAGKEARIESSGFSPGSGLDRAALAGPSIRASRPSPFSN
jgi:hypothetical protein